MEEQKFNKFLRKSINSLLVANAIILGGIDILLGTAHHIVSPKIANQERLESLLDVERKNAGIADDIEVKAYLGNESCAEKVRDKSYEITIAKHFPFNDTCALRHELYHVAGGHCDDMHNFKNSYFGRLGNTVKFLWIYEPEAVIYSATGIKLRNLPLVGSNGER